VPVLAEDTAIQIGGVSGRHALDVSPFDLKTQVHGCYPAPLFTRLPATYIHLYMK